jgi:tRNA (cmo5U34)-methyltransferase
MDKPSDDVWKSPILAKKYLEGVRGAIPLALEQIEVMLRLIEACGPPLRRFMDIGCGDGILGSAILDQHPEAEAVFLDFSEPMLEAARARLAVRAKAARFVKADYGDSAWLQSVRDLAPYDGIVSGFSIHHQRDTRKRELYGEIFELLRPGGVFLNLEHVESESPWAKSVHENLFVDRLHAFHPEATRPEVARHYHDRSDKAANILAPVETQCTWLRQIGYIDVGCYMKIFELALFGGRHP